METPGDILPTMTSEAEQCKVFRAYIGPLVHTPGGVELESVRETYAIVSFAIGEEDRKTFCVKNDQEKHAECKVIETLEAVLPKKPEPTQAVVDIYLNYSPCNEKGSCDKLIKFKKDLQKEKTEVKMTIIFASLYNIIRPGCSECTHSKLSSETLSNQNNEGLITLDREGILLRTFKPVDWNFVAHVLSKGNRQNGKKLLEMKQTPWLPQERTTPLRQERTTPLRQRQTTPLRQEQTTPLRQEQGQTTSLRQEQEQTTPLRQEQVSAHSPTFLLNRGILSLQASDMRKPYTPSNPKLSLTFHRPFHRLTD